LYLEIDNLRKEKEYLTKTNNDILEQLQQTRLSATAVDYNKSKCKFYTEVSSDVCHEINPPPKHIIYS
jgi:hypothetical protein